MSNLKKILDNRLVKGEITKEEYLDIVKTIGNDIKTHEHDFQSFYSMERGLRILEKYHPFIYSPAIKENPPDVGYSPYKYSAIEQNIPSDEIRKNLLKTYRYTDYQGFSVEDIIENALLVEENDYRQFFRKNYVIIGSGYICSTFLGDHKKRTKIAKTYRSTPFLLYKDSKYIIELRPPMKTIKIPFLANQRGDVFWLPCYGSNKFEKHFNQFMIELTAVKRI